VTKEKSFITLKPGCVCHQGSFWQRRRPREPDQHYRDR